MKQKKPNVKHGTCFICGDFRLVFRYTDEWKREVFLCSKCLKAVKLGDTLEKPQSNI